LFIVTFNQYLSLLYGLAIKKRHPQVPFDFNLISGMGYLRHVNANLRNPDSMSSSLLAVSNPFGQRASAFL